jgi:hypothetical protein
MTLLVEWLPDNAYLQALLAKLRYNYHPAKVSWLTAFALCCLPGDHSSDVLQRHTEHSGASAGASLPSSFETECVFSLSMG